jgi:NAD(P)H-flavin reductase
VPTLTCPIRGVFHETPRNRLVRLALDGRRFPFAAGQYVLLGDHGQPARKPYSIACAPVQASASGELEFLIQVSDGESPGPHLARLAPGRLVDVEGPAGSFVLPESRLEGAVAFIGGGTGIAPLRSMIWQVLSTMPGVRVSVLQSARAPEELAYSSELRQLAAEGRIRLIETITRDVPGTWRGERGRISGAHVSRLVDSPGTLCYVCGPDSLVEDVPVLLDARGVPPASIRTEHWNDGVAS